MFYNAFFAVFVVVFSQPSHAHFPAGTTASRWTSDMVLCYVDARSTPAGGFGPEATALFSWNQTRFERLLAYHDAPSDRGGGTPKDTLFDSFLFSGNSWYNGKRFWPGRGIPMNKTDWVNFLDLILDVGVTNLDLAAANVSSHLPFDQTCSAPGLHPAVVLSVPYPDASPCPISFLSSAPRLPSMSSAPRLLVSSAPHLLLSDFKKK